MEMSDIRAKLARKILDIITTSNDDKENLEIIKGLLGEISSGYIINLYSAFPMIENEDINSKEKMIDYLLPGFREWKNEEES